MIKPDQIPFEVKLRLRNILSDGETDEAVALAAAINAWPDMGTEYRSDNPRWYNGHLIILPIEDGE